MKHCPECNRNYADPTLSFCLEDGAPLIYGEAMEEPPTAMLYDTGASGEGPTRAQIHTTDRSAVLPESGKEVSQKAHGLSKKLAITALLVAIVSVGGFFAYRNFRSTGSGVVSSIAVIPFVNDGQNPDLEYLSDGMTETLMNSLNQLPGVSVKARSSVFRYKGKETDAQTIGKELGVQAILNGRVVKRGDDITLFLEMVDTGTGDRMWGEQYTEPVANLITLQNRIARDVSQKLSVKLSAADQKKLGKNYTENAEAYQLYLQGRYFLNKRKPEAFRQAIPFFDRAIANDPNYALAYTGRADSYALLGIYGGGLPPKVAMPKAKDDALKALALDADLAEAHESFAHVLSDYEFDFAGAEKEYKLAIELNPNLASAHQWYGEMLSELGRFDEGLGEMQRAVDLDPLSLIFNRVKARALMYAGRLEEGIEQSKHITTLDPSFPGSHQDLAMAYQINGNYGQSVEKYATWLELLGDAGTAKLARESFFKGGWKGFLLAMTEGSHRSRIFNRFQIASFFVALGDKNAAIQELNTAWEEGAGQLRALKVDPRFDPIRNDPRFQEIYRKVGLP